MPTAAQDPEPEEDDVVFVSEQQVNGSHAIKTESQASPSQTTEYTNPLIDRIALLEGENASLLAAHAAEMASTRTKLEVAELEASRFQRNATEADEENDDLRDRLSEAEQSIQGSKQKSPRTKP